MKAYEHADRQFLPESPYYIIRLDGKAFHTYTRQLKDKRQSDPFSSDLKDAFVESCLGLGKEVEGAMAVYTQSDEVSILVRGFEPEKPNRTPWFGGNVQKWVSVSSSILTAVFNWKIDRANEHVPFAFFDSRVFGLPEKEVNNYFVWRQKDAIRNSVSMYAQHNFSHKSLHGVDTMGQKSRLSEAGLDWEALDQWKQRGTLIARVKKNYIASWTDRQGNDHEEPAQRSVWEPIDLPLFTDKNIFDIVRDENK
jgi:tRNA(His) 5'-end guanylyltransferase